MRVCAFICLCITYFWYTIVYTPIYEHTNKHSYTLCIFAECCVVQCAVCAVFTPRRPGACCCCCSCFFFWCEVHSESCACAFVHDRASASCHKTHGGHRTAVPPRITLERKKQSVAVVRRRKVQEQSQRLTHQQTYKRAHAPNGLREYNHGRHASTLNHIAYRVLLCVRCCFTAAPLLRVLLLFLLHICT